jgi:hypothetical protein
MRTARVDYKLNITDVRFYVSTVESARVDDLDYFIDLKRWRKRFTWRNLHGSNLHSAIQSIWFDCCERCLFECLNR